MPDEPRNLAILDEDVQFVITSGADAVRQGLNRAMGVPPLSLLSREDRSTAEIVLAEVFNNIVEHAYAGLDGSIRVWLSLDDRGLTCRIEDEGRPMPGGQAPAGCLPDPEDLPEGGFGWHLIRSLSTGLSYQRVGSVNRLCFSLPAERSGA